MAEESMRFDAVDGPGARPFGLRFTTDRSGWADLDLQSRAVLIRLRVSDVSDALHDLVESLVVVVVGDRPESRALLEGEPEVYEVHVADRPGGRMSLRVDTRPDRGVIQVRFSVEQTKVVFADSVIEMLAAVDLSGFAAHWPDSSWPARSLARLDEWRAGSTNQDS